MAHRDFAGRSGSKNNKKKAKKSFNRNTLIVLALVAVLGFGLGLYFLKSKTPAPVVTTNVQPEKPQPKSVLPNRPEEVWHYIKELETRTVPVDNNPSSVEKNMRLTEEQRQVLIQMEKEQKAAEEAKKLEAQRKEQEAANAEKAAAQAQQAQPAQTDQTQPTQPQQTAKTEVKKPEPVKKTEPVKKPEPPKKVEVVKMKDAPEVPGDFDMILQNAEGERRQIYFEYPEIHNNNAILDELESFANAIVNDTTPMVTLEQGTEALRIAKKLVSL